MADPQTEAGQVVSSPGMPRWVKVFGVIAIVAVLLFFGLKLFGGAVGGGHGPGRHVPSGETGRSGEEMSGGIGMPAPEDDATRTVEVSALDTLAFDPSTISLSAGETVTFVVTNAGRAVHDFTLGDAAMHQEHAEMMGRGMPHDTPNSVTLQPGETKKLTWRFGDAGTVEYACHEPGHYRAGMRGRITVT